MGCADQLSSVQYIYIYDRRRREGKEGRKNGMMDATGKEEGKEGREGTERAGQGREGKEGEIKGKKRGGHLIGKDQQWCGHQPPVFQWP